MAMGLCACGSASDSLPVDASVTGTYDDQSSADPASADTDTSSPETASPDTENTSPVGSLRGMPLPSASYHRPTAPRWCPMM